MAISLMTNYDQSINLYIFDDPDNDQSINLIMKYVPEKLLINQSINLHILDDPDK